MFNYRLLWVSVMFGITLFIGGFVTPQWVIAGGPLGESLFVVTRLDDPVPNGCLPNDCSLREAVEASNDSPTSIITFDPTAEGTIELTRGTLEITTYVTIRGIGEERTIVDANALSRGFTVRHTAATSDEWGCYGVFSDLTVTGGNANNGGGIQVTDDCNLALDGVIVRNNHATGMGGGIAKEGETGELSIFASAIISNSAAYGGGLSVIGQAESVITGANRYLINVTMSGNTATEDGGGIYFTLPPAHRGDLRLTQVTITDNTALGQGNALAFHDATSPQSGDVRILDSILAGGNSGNTCARVGLPTLFFRSLGYNLATDTSCTLSAVADLPNRDPELSALQWQDGTFLHIPLATSPVIDSGITGYSLDQRHLPRPVDVPGIPNTSDGADRGAYEQQITLPTAVTLSEFGATRDRLSPLIWAVMLGVAYVLAWRRKKGV